METVAKKKPRPRRSFTAEFKAEIVERCRRVTDGRAGGQGLQPGGVGGQKLGGAGRYRLGPARWADQRRPGGAASAAAGEPPPAGRCRSAQAGHGFLREGDPVKLDGFIEAEEAAGHSLKHCCDLFQVSRAAYYQRKQQIPSDREVVRPRAPGAHPPHPRRLRRHLRVAPGAPGAARPGGGLRAAAGAAPDATATAWRAAARSGGARPPSKTPPPKPSRWT